MYLTIFNFDRQAIQVALSDIDRDAAFQYFIAIFADCQHGIVAGQYAFELERPSDDVSTVSI